MRLTSRGVSLVESLLALTLVSFGSLSATMLQLSAKRAHAEGEQRAQAAQLAQDLASQLRAGIVSFSGDVETLAAGWTCVTRPGGGGARIVIVWRGLIAQQDPEEPCARDPQPDGSARYSRHGSDNAFRRTLSLPLTIAAPVDPT